MIEQHIDRLLKVVEPTNLGLGTPDAAALIVRIVRGWACDIAATPKGRAGRRRHPSNRPGERLRQSFSVNVPGSGETRLLATCCSLCGTVGTLRDKVLEAMRRRLDRGTACQEAGGRVGVRTTFVTTVSESGGGGGKIDRRRDSCECDAGSGSSGSTTRSTTWPCEREGERVYLAASRSSVRQHRVTGSCTRQRVQCEH